DEDASEYRSQRKGKQKAVDGTVTAADVVALQKQARDYALANALAEKQAEILSVSDRQDALAVSTKKHYRRYQAHWMNWCERKKYRDHSVTYSKFLPYVRELVAEEPIIHDDEYHSIKPIRVRADHGGLEGDLPSPETIDAYVKSVIDLYGQQMAMQGQSSSHNTVNLRTKEVVGIIKKYKLRYVLDALGSL
ncbi:hypothetical protein BGX34_007413, partial [Mortierella sp. NVP85]